MRLNRNELKNVTIRSNGQSIKAKYAISEKTLRATIKKSRMERGRIDQVSGMPIMATDCYWDNLSGKRLDPKLVEKARAEELEELVQQAHGKHQGSSR